MSQYTTLKNKTASALCLTTAILLAPFAPGNAAVGMAENSERLTQFFSKFDANGNGIVSRGELEALIESKFQEMDADNSGFISLDDLPIILELSPEREARITARKEKIRERIEKRGIEIDAEEFENRARPTRMRFISKHDRDADEQVSLEEFSRRPMRMFDRADQNDDGEVTEAEMRKAAKKLKRRMKRRERAAF